MNDEIDKDNMYVLQKGPATLKAYYCPSVPGPHQLCVHTSAIRGSAINSYSHQCEKLSSRSREQFHAER